MGGFCTPTYTPLPSSGETVEGTEIPSWVAAAGRTLFERSAELANSDYPLYTGARTQTYTGGSNLTDAERQGMGILTSGAENYMPYMNRASDIAGTLGRGYDAMSSSELMGDPYSGASRGYLEGDFKGLSSDELLGNYQGQPAKSFWEIIKGQPARNFLAIHLIYPLHSHIWTFISHRWIPP
jgi:hypothetical protein